MRHHIVERAVLTSSERAIFDALTAEQILMIEWGLSLAPPGFSDGLLRQLAAAGPVSNDDVLTALETALANAGIAMPTFLSVTNPE